MLARAQPTNKMQTINVAKNCRTFPKSYAHIQPFRADPTPEQIQAIHARICIAEGLKEERARELRRNFLMRRESLMRDMKTILAAAFILNRR